MKVKDKDKNKKDNVKERQHGKANVIGIANEAICVTLNFLPNIIGGAATTGCTAIQTLGHIDLS